MAAQGYVVDGQDNDSYAFRDESQAVKAGRVPRIQQSVAPDLSGAARPGPRRCPRCGALLTKFEEPLTAREVQVLELLAEGLPNKAIATRLGISDQTVKFHVSSISGKLGAANRTDAVRRAVRRGLITL